jgi:hypothetical protein
MELYPNNVELQMYISQEKTKCKQCTNQIIIVNSPI